jgi:hypothetical protein
VTIASSASSRPVLLERTAGRGSLLLSSESDQADDAAVPRSANDGQLAEVLVQCDDDLPLSEREAEQLLVPGVTFPGP